ncbi:hypothetical protein H6F46_06850 [Limnothrix sp. FACHB-1083]|uniref:ATP-binding protein n=1 Tax=unclassified Limnothrix TaxID=2632864 RepID=UPI00167FF578|nr:MULTISPECIES: ATP-binding protein [unclassified Limnothrix]MBD2160411.1 hypothetical protein [Limnothrix sp. FACHB-1083]MBD2191112.1 hypothetical protein [Limnothrix sp. FACHB-1088]
MIFEHLQDKHQAATALTRATWGAIAVGALSVVAAPWIAHPAARLLFGSSAATMGALAMATDRQKRKLDVVLKTAEAEGAIATIAALRRELAPARIEQALALPESSDPLPMAQWWGDVLDARLLLICGPQGSGKTSLALRLLADRASQGHQVQVLDPHAAKGQWPYQTIGAGKDYRAIDAAIKDWIDGVEGHYRAIAQDANAPTPTPQTLLAEELTQWADEVESAPKMVRVACSDIRKAKRYLVAVSHGRTLATLGGAKGYRSTIDNAAMVLELDRAADELGASTGRLYRPGNPEPIRVAIDRWAPTPAIAAAATASAIPGVNATHFALEWDLREAIELPHQTIARAEVKQEILDLVLKALDGRSNWFSMAQIKQLRRPLQRVDDADLKSVLDAAVTMGDLEIDQSGAIPKYRLSNV